MSQDAQNHLVVGVLSDTHGMLPVAAFRTLAAMNPDLIIHAGDIGGEEILDQLEMLARVCVVMGNTDFPGQYLRELPRTLELELLGTQIAVAHMRQWLPPALPRLAIVGHTHTPAIVQVGATTILNPGSTTQPRGGSAASVARVELETNYIRATQIVPIGE